MSRIFFSFLIIYLCLHPTHQDDTADVETIAPDGHYYDFIVFSQEWPVTICKFWLYESNGTECVYPLTKNRWTVHGIWPTAVDLDPNISNFCKNSSTFDAEQIKSIEGELEQAWTNIYKGTDPYIFWGHQWMKHGTCATDLEPINTQLKYFRKGIEWNQKYSIMGMFSAAKIFPDDNKEFTVDELVAAVKDKIVKNPMVDCYTMDGLQYLQEMRLCFDKQLNLIDCDQIAKNCNVSKGIIFPANA